MKSVIAALLVSASCCLMPAAYAGGDMGEDLKSGAFWKLTKQELIRKYADGERGGWVDKAQTKMRLSKPGIKLSGLSIGETIMNWKDAAMEDMVIMVYNKGDDGVMDKSTFNNRLKSVKETVSQLTGVEPKEYKAGRGEAVVKVRGWIWVWEKGAIVVEANASNDRNGFEAEFIRMKLGPNQEAVSRDKSNRTSRSAIAKNLEKKGKRMVIKNVPMIDQGEKGYCAVATVARIFSYFGIEHVDQHEIASLANTSAEGGTDPMEMMDNLKSQAVKFHVRIRQLDSIREMKDFTRLLKAYNKAAKKLKKQTVNESTRDFSGFWASADADALRAARASGTGQVSKWVNTVKQYVSAGVPVLWSVQLGIVPEPMRISQERGGHMRLIIGIDEEKQAVIFSDSWGARHEEKEMPLKDAIAITTGLWAMQPSQ